MFIRLATAVYSLNDFADFNGCAYWPESFRQSNILLVQCPTFPKVSANCAYMHVCVFACMCICMYVYMHVCVYACMCISMYVYMHVCVYACMCNLVFCMYVYMPVYACMCICMHVKFSILLVQYPTFPKVSADLCASVVVEVTSPHCR